MALAATTAECRVPPVEPNGLDRRAAPFGPRAGTLATGAAGGTVLQFRSLSISSCRDGACPCAASVAVLLAREAAAYSSSSGEGGVASGLRGKDASAWLGLG
eukprot:scaffold94009_cov38-Phaeocystis_antarctica.AAC.1